MSLPQEKFREIVFLLLYGNDTGYSEESDIVALLMEELSVSERSVLKALQKTREIIAKQEEIDSIITNTSTSYAFERIQTVERNLLRLGVFEISFDETIPPKVAIAEAMRLARKFGTSESAFFVNAILDHIYKISLGEKADTTQLTQTLHQVIENEQKAQEAVLEIQEKLKPNDSEE